MGSGELTATMVEVHKDLLRQLPETPQAVFLDTPAGFQLNVDQISARAADYFQTRVRHPLQLASFKSSAQSSDYDQREANRVLRQADFVLIGPGSPTYAIRQWQPSQIPDLLARCVNSGGCLVAASAAALTVGRFTLPVYEIYKVGQELHWVDGIDLLGRFGFNLVVVPHWNNAEGGNHDTRFCFMGATRFDALTTMLPQALPILGLDEHTACILDLATDQAEVKGIGGITLRTTEGTMTVNSGGHFALSVLREGSIASHPEGDSAVPESALSVTHTEGDFWQQAHSLEARFQAGLDKEDAHEATNALLEFDRILWQAQQGLEDEAVVAQARDTFRDMLVFLGNQLNASPERSEKCLAPLVESLLDLRQELRREKQWDAADRLRKALNSAGIQVEDTPDGHRWHLNAQQ
jgi:peptidase E